MQQHLAEPVHPNRDGEGLGLVEQPGHPLVEVQRKGDRLEFRQKRFTFLENESDQRWLVPISVTVFLPDRSTRTVSTLLEGKSANLDLGKDATAF